MIEIKKSLLLGTIESASAKGQIVVPIQGKDCIMACGIGFKKAWPDLLFVQEKSCLMLHVGEADACTYLPYRRLDLREIQTTGLLKFKDLIEASKEIYAGEMEITYQDLASIVLKNDLVGYVHRKYLEAKS